MLVSHPGSVLSHPQSVLSHPRSVHHHPKYVLGLGLIGDCDFSKGGFLKRMKNFRKESVLIF